MSEDLSYYETRAAEEEAAAGRAEDPAVAEAHRELARRYRAIAAGKLSLAAIRDKDMIDGKD